MSEMIKLEYKPELTNDIKTESVDQVIFASNIKTEQDVDPKDLINDLLETAIKEEQECHDDMYRIDIKGEKLGSTVKEEICSNEMDGQSFPEIKTEELILKSESENGDSETGADGKSQMKDHKMNDNNPTKKYACNLCDFKTHFKNSLKRHIIVKHDNDSIKKHGCDFCHYRSHKMSHVKGHILIKHHKNSVKMHGCDLCDYNTHKKYNLTKHLCMKHDMNLLKKHVCVFCDYKTLRMRDFRKHILCKHDKNSIKRHGCDICEYKTHQKYNLDRHIMAKHDKNSVKKHSCDICDYRTHEKSTMNRHIMTKHKEILKQPILLKQVVKVEKVILGTDT